MRRSLILAGGGLKVAWCAGALEVLIGEAGLTFDHIDATSGSVYTLAMLLSGRTVSEVAETWCRVSPLDFLSFQPLWRYLAIWRLRAWLTRDAVRDRLLPRWGIDLDRIRACRDLAGHPITGTFNVLDFTRKEVRSIPHPQLDRADLLAADAVPGMLPPVRKRGTLLMDPMYVSNANLREAVRQGAEEIWVLWPMEDRPEWIGGPWNHLTQIYEMCATADLKRQLREIDELNRDRAKAPGAAVPEIQVHLLGLTGPLPVGYLLYRRKREVRETVEAGRARARRYLSERGYLDGPRAAAS